MSSKILTVEFWLLTVESHDFKNYFLFWEGIRSYAWSFGHPDPDLSSVNLVKGSMYGLIFGYSVF
jgi:hypothetical protein